MSDRPSRLHRLTIPRPEGTLPSSAVRSSIAISSCGGSGQARRKPPRPGLKVLLVDDIYAVVEEEHGSWV
jgi:hypothetical protein